MRFRNVTKMCDTEARRCFDDFATSGENTDPRFIEQRDIQQIWDDLRLVADRPSETTFYFIVGKITGQVWPTF